MFKITAAIRGYFNYRYDKASFELELANLKGLRVPDHRDFRTRKQRLEDEAESGDTTEANAGIEPRIHLPNVD